MVLNSPHISHLLDGKSKLAQHLELSTRATHQAASHSTDNSGPFLAIITCGDLQQPPTHLLDLEDEQAMVFQTAACIGGAATVAGVSYAVATHGIRLIIVLGHSCCSIIEHCRSSAHDLGVISRTVERSRRHLIGAEGNSRADAPELLSAHHTLCMAQAWKREMLPTHDVEVIPMFANDVSGRVGILGDPLATI